MFADALHAYFGVCGMSLLSEPGLASMHAALNLSQHSAHHLHSIHRGWTAASGDGVPATRLDRNRYIDYLQCVLDRFHKGHIDGDRYVKAVVDTETCSHRM